MTIFIMLLTLVVFLILGLPAIFSMAFSTIVFFVLERGIMDFPFGLFAQRAVYGLDNFALIAIPLFLLVGRVMNDSGTTERLFNFARSIVGHMKGGLAHVNVVASVIFAGMSGSAVADAAGLGQIEIKAMRKAKYDLDFSCAVTAASSLIGPIIPPSVPVILYAILAGVSVNSLLIAGVIPGLVLAASLMIYISYVAKKRNYPVDAKASLKVIVTTFKKAFLPLLAPIGLLAGILSGIFTATEAAAVVALYAIFLSVIVYKSITWKGLYDILRNVMYDSGIVMIIITMAEVYSYILTRQKLPEAISNLIFGISDNYWFVMAMVIIFLLFMGCFMSATVSLLITTPVLVPLIVASGGDALHFGIIMILTLMVGELTPPFGMVLFAIMKVSDIPFDRLVRACFPFLIPIMAVIILAVIFPQIITFLPHVIGGN